MNVRILVMVVVTLTALSMTGERADAWTPNGVLVAAGSGNQNTPRVASDGNGGAFVLWTRPGNGWDGYSIQHLTASGAPAAGWPAGAEESVRLTDAGAGGRLLSDGSGGVYVLWYQGSDGDDWDIYLVRVNADGSIAPGWPVTGVAVCAARHRQQNPELVSDQVGGVIVAWEDKRNGFADGTDPTNAPYAETDLFCQRVSPSGALMWGPDGVPLCTAPGNQFLNAYDRNGVSDDAGGALWMWTDSRTGTGSDVYAQRVTASGLIAAGWTTDGVGLCTQPKNQGVSTVVADGGGGAICVWLDDRSGAFDLYASKVDGTGHLAAGWLVNGTAVSTAPGGQYGASAVEDGKGGLIVAWEDYRESPGNPDIFGMHLTSAGARTAGWSLDGTPLCVAPSFQTGVMLCKDAEGGAYAAWSDLRNSPSLMNPIYDLYCQRVTAAGTPVSGWTVNGVRLCEGEGQRIHVRLAATEAGGAIAAWDDTRNGAGQDIFAQGILPQGVAPQDLLDVPASGVASGLWLSAPFPNPARSSCRIRFATREPESIQLELLDVQGRRIRGLRASTAGSMQARELVVPLRDAPPGVYFLRLRAETGVLERRVVVLD